MIKKIHEITVLDVVLLDQTKSANHLKKIKFIPFGLVKKSLERLIREIEIKLGSQTTNDLSKEYNKTLAYQKLQLLDALYYGLIAEFSIKSKIDAYKVISGIKLSEREDLLKLIELVKEHTGIDVLEEDGFKKFEKHRIFKQDKFAENYPKKEDDNKPTRSMAEIVMSYLKHSNGSVIESNRFLMFVAYKNLVDESIKKNQ